jgi:DNA-binding IscR family transcriptional regulator
MAVHVLAVLAYKDGDRVTSEFLAHSVNTNPVVIRRLLLALQEARLVETRKGAGFGSRLSRSAARIDLGEVFRAVERDEAFGLPPKKPNQACPVGHCIHAALEPVFGSALNALKNDLARTTLGDILKKVRACCAEASGSAR